MLEELQKELEDLKEGLEKKLITVNYYCSFYHSISKRIEKLQNNPPS